MITVYTSISCFPLKCPWLYIIIIIVQITILIIIYTSYHAYLSKDVFILSKEQYSSPVVALHDRLKCWEQQYQCQTISKITFEATSIKQCG